MKSQATAAEIETALAGRGLPFAIRSMIETAVDDLQGPARLDVALELAAHFEDGMQSGQTAEELLEDFGDGRLVARWMAREKNSNRRGVAGLKKRGNTMFDVFVNNLRYAGRKLRKNPGFTLTAILSLALGIGANTAIFSLVNAVLIRESPYQQPEQLVEVYRQSPEMGFGPMSYPDFRDVRDNANDVFVGIAGSGYTFASASLDEGTTELIAGEMVSANYFSLLGIPPALGRVFGPDDELAKDAHPVVMLSHGFWQRAFGGDLDVVGADLVLNSRPYTIVGIVPETYGGNIRGIMPDFYAPIVMVGHLQPSESDKLEERGSHFFFTRARLKSSITLPQANASVANVVADLRERRANSWLGEGDLLLVPTEDVILNPSVDQVVLPAMTLLMAIVGLVLLIACANLASFLLAKAVDAKRDVAIRLAMGATRKTLIGQLLTENILLALVGGVAGVGLASGLITVLSKAETPLPFPVGFDLSLDATVLLFSLFVSVLAGLFFGLVPALQATNPDVAGVLREEAASAGRGKGTMLRNSIVVGQVAVSLLMLVTAGLFLRSLMAGQSIDPGFGTDPTAVVSVIVSPDDYSREETEVFLNSLVEQAEQLPGVLSTGMTDNLHLNPLNQMGRSFNVDGVEPPVNESAQSGDFARVDGGYFEAVGIPILQGRTFNSSDLADGPPVVVVSQALANRFFPGEDPIGQMLRRGDNPDWRIVGVAGDAKVRTLGEEPRSMLYRPFSQDFSMTMTLVATSSIDPRQTAQDIVRLLHSLDPDVIVFETKTMQDHLAVMLLPQKVGAVVISAFAVLAMILACIGLYGTVSYAVAQRLREVGIRLSLGADAGQVVRMLTASGMKLVLIGAGIGMVLSLAVTRVLSGLLFGIGTLDPVTFLVVPVLFASVGVVAAYLPARRASKVDPVVALRTD